MFNAKQIDEWQKVALIAYHVVLSQCDKKSAKKIKYEDFIPKQYRAKPVRGETNNSGRLTFGEFLSGYGSDNLPKI